MIHHASDTETDQAFPLHELSSTPELVLDCRSNLAESVIWDDREDKLVWVDIHAGVVWSWRPLQSAEPKSVKVGSRIGAVALSEGPEVIVAREAGFAAIDLSTGVSRSLGEVPNPVTNVRLNDGRVDPVGRFVCGGMDESEPQRSVAALYSLSAHNGCATMLESIRCTNSICWSPSGTTFYFTDMPTRRIDAFDYDIRSGTLSNRRLFCDLSDEPGLPDGSIVDAEGCLWNAQWGGAKLVRYTPDGRVDREVRLPVTNPTCLAFGGKDLDVLFVTTAWFGLTSVQRGAQPTAGSIYAFRPGVRGRAEYRFGAR
ncbi:SMP-30/gluconolactonase/LRE family protein [Devosia sp.]|uniref:SMP-30/gluconolactonase/LRE family protein n=1 Tax=Devosia sp. TaxID=1871048 RepID=UPI003449E28D